MVFQQSLLKKAYFFYQNGCSSHGQFWLMESALRLQPIINTSQYARNLLTVCTSSLNSKVLKHTLGRVLFTNHFQKVNGTFLFKSFRWKILEWKSERLPFVRKISEGEANGTVHSAGCFPIKGNTFRDIRRFQFNQNFRKFGTSGNNGTEIARKSFQKFRKLVNFRKANHSTENSGKFREQSWMERNLPGKFLWKISVYIALNFAYHLPKLWTDQFAHVNGSGKW